MVLWKSDYGWFYFFDCFCVWIDESKIGNGCGEFVD